MLGFLRRLFPQRKPHPSRRELMGLLICIVAWRRADLDARLQEETIKTDAAAEELEGLRWYWQGSGGIDPFVTEVLSVPVGGLPEDLFLLSLYRIEAAVGIAWALGLIAEIPPSTEPADLSRIVNFFPPQGSPDAALRDPAILDSNLAELAHLLDDAHARKNADPSDRDRGIEFSRTYERVRGLRWAASDVDWLHQVEP